MLEVHVVYMLVETLLYLLPMKGSKVCTLLFLRDLDSRMNFMLFTQSNHKTYVYNFLQTGHDVKIDLEGYEGRLPEHV